MKRGFSFVELMIVVAVLGILAAVVIPQFQSYTTEAKEVVAKDNLRLLRSAIELYAAQHNGVSPGYPFDNPAAIALEIEFKRQMLSGDYLSAVPQNPFNNKATLRMIANNEPFPAAPTGQYGWVYQPKTKTIKLDWSGSDRDGIQYYDY